MKKIYSLLAAIILFAGLAQAQCTVDQTNTTFFTPAEDSIPCIIQGTPFSQVIQIHIPASVDAHQFIAAAPVGFIILTINYVKIDSIAGFPSGITAALNPISGQFNGGTNGCVHLSGTTNAALGAYKLTYTGTVSAHIPVVPVLFPNGGDTIVPLSLLTGQVNVPDTLNVCSATNINSFTADLNKALSVYPNPNNGTFEVTLNGGSRVNGELRIVDVTGRIVYTQNLDVVGFYNTTIDLTKFSKGMYTVQLRTAEGFASKNISVE